MQLILLLIKISTESLRKYVIPKGWEGLTKKTQSWHKGRECGQKSHVTQNISVYISVTLPKGYLCSEVTILPAWKKQYSTHFANNAC